MDILSLLHDYYTNMPLGEDTDVAEFLSDSAPTFIHHLYVYHTCTETIMRDQVRLLHTAMCADVEQVSMALSVLLQFQHSDGDLLARTMELVQQSLFCLAALKMQKNMMYDVFLDSPRIDDDVICQTVCNVFQRVKTRRDNGSINDWKTLLSQFLMQMLDSTKQTLQHDRRCPYLHLQAMRDNMFLEGSMFRSEYTGSYIELDSVNFSLYTGGQTDKLDVDNDVMHVYELEEAVVASDAGAGGKLVVFQGDCHAGYTHIEVLDVQATKKNFKDIFKDADSGVEKYEDRILLKNTDITPPFKPRTFEKKMLYEEHHGPAVNTIFVNKDAFSSLDSVFALKCSSFPQVAQEFLSRQRPFDFPSTNSMKELTKDCLLVPTGHKKSRNVQLEWRFSFSLQERYIIRKLWTEKLRYCYWLVKAAIKQEKDTGSSCCLSTYHIKTAMFWMLEQEVSLENFNSMSIVDCVLKVLEKLKRDLQNRSFPNYFISKNNMVDHVEHEEVKGSVRMVAKVLNNYIPYAITNMYIRTGSEIGLWCLLPRVGEENPVLDMTIILEIMQEYLNQHGFLDKLKRLRWFKYRSEGVAQGNFKTFRYCDEEEMEIMKGFMNDELSFSKDSKDNLVFTIASLKSNREFKECLAKEQDVENFVEEQFRGLSFAAPEEQTAAILKAHFYFIAGKYSKCVEEVEKIESMELFAGTEDTKVYNVPALFFEPGNVMPTDELAALVTLVDSVTGFAYFHPLVYGIHLKLLAFQKQDRTEDEMDLVLANLLEKCEQTWIKMWPFSYVLLALGNYAARGDATVCAQQLLLADEGFAVSFNCRILGEESIFQLSLSQDVQNSLETEQLKPRYPV